MSPSLLVFLLTADVVLTLAMANGPLPTITGDVQSELSSYPPAPSPTHDQNAHKSQAPMNRKLAKHHHRHHQHRRESEAGSPIGSPSAGPSMTPAPQGEAHNVRSADQAASSSDSESISLQHQGQQVQLRGHHRSVDKSIAGGGVILGGLATTFLVAVFCYIRATGRHKTESTV